MPNASQVDIERETLHRLTIYTRSIDSREWTRLADVFAPDCVKERVGPDGSSRSLLSGRNHIIEDLKTNLGRLGPTQHLLGNHEVQALDEEAESRTYVRAFHRGAGKKHELWLDILGEYRIRWHLFNEGWRVVRWTLRIIDSVGDPEAVTASPADSASL